MSGPGRRRGVGGTNVGSPLVTPGSTLDGMDRLLREVFDELRRWDGEVTLDVHCRAGRASHRPGR